MLPKTAISHHLNADPSAVARWAHRGMPLHSLEVAAAWHSAHIRQRQKRKPVPATPASTVVVANGAEPPIRSWYDQRQRCLTKIAERELARLEGTLLDAADVKAATIKVISTARARLLSVPSRVAPQFPESIRTRLYGLIEAEIHAALWELSGKSPEEALDE